MQLPTQQSDDSGYLSTQLMHDLGIPDAAADKHGYSLRPENAFSINSTDYDQSDSTYRF